MTELSPLAYELRRRNLTYLSESRLATLERFAGVASRLGGDFAEAGVALGGSAILLAALTPAAASFHGYDVFGMIPPPTSRDDPHSHQRYAEIRSGRSAGIGGERYYGYLPELYERVCASFADFEMPVDQARICLHMGLFEETLRPRAPIALMHIDSDWYDSVALCLERVYPMLAPGGFIVLDDYADYGGCREATDEFLAAHSDLRIVENVDNLVVHVSPDRRLTAL